MKYLFDTDHISFIQRRSSQEYANIAAKIAKHSPGDFAFSIVSLHEQVLGANAFINKLPIGNHNCQFWLSDTCYLPNSKAINIIATCITYHPHECRIFRRPPSTTNYR